MSTGTALYYPYIHPRDINCLKAALLYWDRIRRIVPDSLNHDGQGLLGDDSDECKLLVNEQLLVATSPTVYEADAEKLFFSEFDKDNSDYVIDRDAAEEISQNGGVLHIQKLASSVVRELEDRGFAHKFGEWMSMHRDVAGLYMHCLASSIATSIKAPLLADSALQSVAGQALLFGGHGVERELPTLLNIGIQLPSALQMASVPIERVVRFSQNRVDERIAFRTAIEGIIKVAGDLTDPNQLSDYLATEKLNIKRVLVDMRQVIDEVYVGAVSTAVKISVPSAIGAATGYLAISPECAIVFGAVGLSISAISCFAETRGKLRQAKKAAPYHYLLSLGREFSNAA